VRNWNLTTTTQLKACCQQNVVTPVLKFSFLGIDLVVDSKFLLNISKTCIESRVKARGPFIFPW
jgi:hypothetical protein